MDAGHWLLVVALFGSWAVAYYARRTPPPERGVTVEEWRKRLARRRGEDES